jgi:hypothetical protein
MAGLLQAMWHTQGRALIIAKVLKKRWNQIAIFVVPFIGWLIFFFQNQPNLSDSFIGKDISIILEAMPERDREKLEYFFQRLILDEDFGYVLLGEKPMAHETLWTKVNPLACLFGEKGPAANDDFIPTLYERFCFYFHEAISSGRIKYNKSYETWVKYRKFFPMSRFCLFYENAQASIFDQSTITIINKKTFIKKIQQYNIDFQIVLNREVYGEELLAEGLSKSFLSEVLMHHDGLIGTLLGYGRDHAFWYHQRYCLHSNQEKAEFCEKFYLGFKLTDEIGESWTDEEYAKFREEKNASIVWTFPPCFRADPSSVETQNLRRQYLETREAIADYYSGKDFLEATLRLLTSKSDDIVKSPCIIYRT